MTNKYFYTYNLYNKIFIFNRYVVVYMYIIVYVCNNSYIGHFSN